MQSFLAAFYNTLLPEILASLGVRSYRLWWYPAVGDSVSVGMGYYDDDGIEPWRSLTVTEMHAARITVSSAQVQLRVKFDQRVAWVDWDRFRATSRLHLGCRCSMQ